MLLDDKGFVKTGADLRADEAPGRGLAPAAAPLPAGDQHPRRVRVGDVRADSVKRVASAVGEGSICVQLVHRALQDPLTPPPVTPQAHVPWARSVPSIVVFLGVVAVIAVGTVAAGVLTSNNRVRARARRAIEGRETIAIAALREGVEAKVRGVVAAREPLLTSPIGGHACIGYQAGIGERLDDTDETWRAQVLDRSAWRSFLVTDQTGTVRCEGRSRYCWTPLSAGPTPPTAYALLKEDAVRLNDPSAPGVSHFERRY